MGLSLSTERQTPFPHASRRITDLTVAREPRRELTPGQKTAEERAPQKHGEFWIALMLILVGVGWPALIVAGLVRLAWRIIAG